MKGGISNAEPVYFKVAFKPPATIGRAQGTSTYDGSASVLEAKGRHDPCVVPRAVPIVEAMAAICVMDLLMQQLGREASVARMPAASQEGIPTAMTTGLAYDPYASGFRRTASTASLPSN